MQKSWGMGAGGNPKEGEHAWLYFQCEPEGFSCTNLCSRGSSWLGNSSMKSFHGWWQETFEPLHKIVALFVPATVEAMGLQKCNGR